MTCSARISKLWAVPGPASSNSTARTVSRLIPPGRIYVADTYNCRIDRMDDITGANWKTFGTCGSGANQFSTGGLADLAVDSLGRIYVADPGNGRMDRFDDMTGTNWTTFGTPGSGTDQLIGAQGVAVDSSNRIYIADAGNRRIVRIDDMAGTNWTTLTQSPTNRHLTSTRSDRPPTSRSIPPEELKWPTATMLSALTT